MYDAHPESVDLDNSFIFRITCICRVENRKIKWDLNFIISIWVTIMDCFVLWVFCYCKND